MESKGQLGQILKLSGSRCARGGSEGAFTITVGKATKECSYRTPVLGRDLEIAATMTLFNRPQVPKSVLRSSYVAVDLRAGGGARYQLATFPTQRKAQVRKVLSDGSIEYLDIEKGSPGSVVSTNRPSCGYRRSTSPPARKRAIANCSPPSAASRSPKSPTKVPGN